MEIAKQLLTTLYVYCTDFLINLANIIGLSYYEINAIIFCFLMPILAVLGVIYLFYLKWQLFKKAHE